MASKIQYRLTVKYKSGRIEELILKNKARWDGSYSDLVKLNTVEEVKKWIKKL